jgi:hypothetical protein
MSNVYFFELTAGQDFDELPDASGSFTGLNLEATIPSGEAVTDYFKAGSDMYVTSVATGSNTVGANAGILTSWSWAGVSGALAGF